MAADALLRRDWRDGEWPGVMLSAALAVTASSGRSWGERAVLEAKFWLRRRLSWIAVSVDADADAMVLDVRGTRRVWCYDFVHRGRLDLATRDESLARRLANLADSLADAGQDTHLAIHVEKACDGEVRTVLSMTVPSRPSREWRRDARSGVSRLLSVGRTPIIERRTYVRAPDAVARTLRVSHFAPGRESAALERLSDELSWLTLSLHASVLPALRARRVTSRAVHRVGSDAQLARSAGFRWSARREWELEGLRQREQVVASGSALCQWALYLVVHASSLAQLRSRVHELVEITRSVGLQLDHGVARQAEWLAFQLPGGPGW